MTLQLPSNELVTVPFCKLGTPVVDFVLPPIIGSEDSLTQTQQFGIPPVQAQDPLFGGLPVLRKETNGVLQFYSNVLYFMNQGGQFTFDLDQSAALGGYSEGAVLFDFATSSYVVSLIDNNTFDFVMTPSYIDGTHWQTLNKLNYPDITNVGGLVSIIGPVGLNVLSNFNVVGTSLFNNAVTCSTDLIVGVNLIVANTAGRGGVIIYESATNTAYLGSNDTGTGGFNGFLFNDDVARATINNSSLVGVAGNWVASIGDINTNAPHTLQFSLTDDAGNAWLLTCTSVIGPFPAVNGVLINGQCDIYNYGIGGNNRTIDLAAAGIVAGGPTVTVKGVISVLQTSNIGSGNLLELSIAPSSPTGLSIGTNAVGPSTVTLSFEINYK